MRKKTIFVFDDVPELKQQYANALQEVGPLRKGNYEVVSLSFEVFRAQMEILNRRRERTRDRKSWGDEFAKLDGVGDHPHRKGRRH